MERTGVGPVARLRWFVVWAVLGAAYATGLIGALSVGLVVLPLAIVVTVVLLGRRAGLAGLPGAAVGVGGPLLYLAYVNRAGPGVVCSPLGGGGMRCVDETNPWPWLAAGVVAVVVGLVLPALLRRGSPSRG